MWLRACPYLIKEGIVWGVAGASWGMPSPPFRVSPPFGNMTKCQMRRARTAYLRAERRLGQIRDACAPELGQLASGKRFLLDRCMRQGRGMRKRKWGASAIGGFGFLFAFSAEGLSLPQIEIYAGKSTAKSRFPDELFPKCGVKSGDVRTSAQRHAEKKSLYCGKRRAPLRKTNGSFAEFSVNDGK